MKNKLHTSVLSLCLMASLLFGPPAQAQDQVASQPGPTSVPNLIRYSGMLKEANSTPLASQTVGVTFSIFKESEGGVALWHEVRNVTTDASGQYNILLGSTMTEGVPPELFSDQEQRWLSVQMEGRPEQPRSLLVSVPYAFKAHEAETLGGLPASAFMKAPTAEGSTGAASAETAAALTGLSTVGALGTASQTAATSGKGKAPCPPGTNHILYWDATNDICPSAITQDPSNGNIGIGLPSNVQASEPLDVQGVISTYTWYDINENRMLSVGNTGTANNASTNLFLGWNTGTVNNGDTTNNTFMGRDAGPANTTGHDNTFSGYKAGNANVGGNEPAGSYNSFAGSQAGLLNTTGFLNTFHGYTAGFGNTTGSQNSCLGSAACLHNLTGVQNVAVGAGAGFRNTDGSANVYVGFDSGWGNSGVGSRGSNNTMTGWETGFDNFGSNNVFYGYQAGFSNTTGSSNIAIGAGAGSTAGSGNSNNIYIGNPGTNEGSPAIRIGLKGTHISQTYMAGIWLTPIPGGVPVLVDSNGHLGVSASLNNNPVQGNCSSPGTFYLTKWLTSNQVQCSSITELANTFVGIGTTTPNRQLQVNGNIDIPVTSTAHYQVTGKTVLSIDGTNNLFTGVGAGTASGSTNSNTFTGFNAGNINTANENSYFGYKAGALNVSGARNVFIGSQAGASNATGGGNTSVGALAGMMADGCCSTFVGHGAGQNTTVGGNQFFGYRAGGSTTTGFANVFTGYFTGFANTTGTYNSFYGVNTGILNDTGSMNSFFGVGAGSQSNVSGSSNIYVGFNAGNGAGAGNSNNIYLGSPGANETGAIRIGLEGAQASQTYMAGIWSHPTNGLVPTFVTVDSQGHLGYDTPGGGGGGNVTGNCTLGANFLARWTNSTGDINCSHIWETQSGTFFVGINTTTPGTQLDVNGDINAAYDQGSYQIGLNTVLTASGDRNTILGYTGAHTSSTGQQNTFLGANAGQVNTNGQWNVFVGSATGASNIGGYGNVFVGQQAGRDNVNGHDNTFVGEFAGTVSNPNGSYNTYLGDGTGQNNNNGSSNLYLMSLGTNESNTIRIGSEGTGNGQQNAAYIAGVYPSLPSGGALYVCIDGSGKLGAQPAPCGGSSSRFKEQVTAMGDSSSKLFQLRPVTFFYNPKNDDGSHLQQFGLIAEEVAKIFPEMVVYDKEGQPYTVKYQMLAPMLLNEFQKQNKVVATQQDELASLRQQTTAQQQQVVLQQQQIDTLKSQLQLQNAAFQERLSRLESLLSTQVASTSTTSLTASSPNGGQ